MINFDLTDGEISMNTRVIENIAKIRRNTIVVHTDFLDDGNEFDVIAASDPYLKDGEWMLDYYMMGFQYGGTIKESDYLSRFSLKEKIEEATL